MAAPTDHPQQVNNARIISLILSGDPTGEELLYVSFHRGLRFLAVRLSPLHADDCVQDTFLIAIKQIRTGKLSSPEALPAYLRTILRRMTWNFNAQSNRRTGGQDAYETAITSYADHRPDPEQELGVKDQARMMMDCLRSLKPRDQEILTRFYLQNQTAEDICSEMRLTETQFRLYKSRSKKLLEHAVAKLKAQTRIATSSSTEAGSR
jgi:RNA polymerase sigma-70 factor, ECF subfamily